MSQRDESANRQIVGYCRLTIDGYLIMVEQEMTITGDQVPMSYSWRFPLGLGGQPHYLGVDVTFRERR